MGLSAELSDVCLVVPELMAVVSTTSQTGKSTGDLVDFKLGFLKGYMRTVIFYFWEEAEPR